MWDLEMDLILRNQIPLDLVPCIVRFSRAWYPVESDSARSGTPHNKIQPGLPRRIRFSRVLYPVESVSAGSGTP
jgi:hypothetical protein